MECYSVIKRDAFESVLMRWMNLEPITQSEVNQKEKKQMQCINSYMWNLERQYQWSYMQAGWHRCKEQTFGLSGRRWGWDDLRGWQWNTYIQFRSVQSLSHFQLFATPCLQHTRPPHPSPIPGVYSNSCPLRRWCHPTISSSVIPFSCPQSFPASGSFPVSWLFASGGQKIGASASASVLPMNILDWLPLGWTCWISLLLSLARRILSSPMLCPWSQDCTGPG